VPFWERLTSSRITLKIAGKYKPITCHTRKDVQFILGEEQAQAFQRERASITESIMLEYPNPNKPFDLYSDASSTHAMGAILCQDGKVISTFSRKFNNAQLKYTITGQELLACMEACKHFAQIIHGCEVRIHTDHKKSPMTTPNTSTCGSNEHEYFWMQSLHPLFITSMALIIWALMVSVDSQWHRRHRSMWCRQCSQSVHCIETIMQNSHST
jgi:hypothetical protein